MPSPRKVPERFLVSFSFAGEQRNFVHQLAGEIEKRLGSSTVFYDEWFEFYIAGEDADLRLQDIYCQKSDLVIVCVSKEYGNKPWTQAEHSAIRAKIMRAKSNEEFADDRSVMPIRVGDGDVKGINFNAVVPDYRKRSVSDCADQIIARLQLVHPGISAGGESSTQWTEAQTDINWIVADHADVRNAFKRLLMCDSNIQLLPIKGLSETGKSHITKQMLGTALRIDNLVCGRFDFKGTTGMDMEVHNFIQHMEITSPPSGGTLNEQLSHMFNSLKQTKSPTLLIFDTYELAGEAEEWVERQLLPSLIRSSWLKIVIAGQKPPKITGMIWEQVSNPLILMKTPLSQDWFEYCKQFKPDLSLEFVEKVCEVAEDNPALIAQLLGPKT